MKRVHEEMRVSEQAEQAMRKRRAVDTTAQIEGDMTDAHGLTNGADTFGLWDESAWRNG